MTIRYPGTWIEQNQIPWIARDLMNTSVHLIHIGLGVTGKHLEALQGATPPIQYEPAKKAHLNGQAAPVQSK
jgi:hypothetical protein